MWLKKLFFVLMMIVLIGNSFPRVSQAREAIPDIGQLALAPVDYLPPAMTAIDVVGNYAYVGAGPSLLVFDVSDPANPRRVGYTVRTSVEESNAPYYVNALMATPDRVYIKTGVAYNFSGVNNPRLLIYDVSQAEYPRLAAIYDYETLGGSYLAAEGMRLYVATVSGVKILDATDPLHLVEISTYTNPDLARYGMIDIQDGMLTLLSGVDNPDTETEQGVLLLVDLIDPFQPVEIGMCEITLARYAWDMYVSDTLAVIVDSPPPGSTFYNSRGELIDLSDPAHPASIATFDAGYGRLPDSAILNQLLIVGVSGWPPNVYDISDPSSPQWLENLDWPMIDMTAETGFLYIAGGAAGLSIYTNPSGNTLVKQGHIIGIGRAEDISLASGSLAIADGGHDGNVSLDWVYGGLAVSEIAPDQPLSIAGKFVDKYGYLGAGAYITADGDSAYLVGGSCSYRFYGCSETFYAINIGQPSAPSLTGKYTPIGYEDNPPFAGPITIHGGYAYLPGAIIDSYRNGVAIFDVGQEITPTLASYYEWPSAGDYALIYSLAITGTHGLISTSNYGIGGYTYELHVLDITNPISPTVMWSYPLGGHVQVFLQDGLSFIAEQGYEDNSIFIFDTGQLPLIERSSRIYTDEPVLDVAYDGRYAYMANRETGLIIYDLVDPAVTRKLYTYDSPGTAKRVILDGEYVYLADGEGGLFVFRKTYLYPQAYMPLVPIQVQIPANFTQ